MNQFHYRKNLQKNTTIDYLNNTWPIHGLSARLVKKQAAARKLSKGKKKAMLVYTGNENKQSRFNLSYKKRTRYMQNKEAFPKKKLPTKNIDQLVEMGIIDERGFFKK